MSYDPTPAMAERCEAWLGVVDTLEKYLNAASMRYDWIDEATSKMSREMPQPEDLGSQFAPIGKGGIKDVFVKLWWDLILPDGKAAESASKIIKNELLKEVELLKEDLTRSISDFQDHSASFDSTLAPSKTAALRDSRVHAKIDEYQRAISAAEAGKQPEIDPYLLKLNLDRRIDRTVRKHNAQADAYAYVQDAAKRVDAEVTQRVQSLLKRYTDIVERNGNIIAGGGRAIRSVFVNQPQLFEYKYWLQSNKAPSSFVGSTGENAKKRESDNDLGYPKEESVYAKAIRAGLLERRSKILRTYSPGDYVLTPLSLIEMRQNQPVWSIDLRGAKLLENDKASAEDQFVIEAKQHGSSSGKMHRFVFRAKIAANWKRDLATVCAGQIPKSLTDLVKNENSDFAYAGKSTSATGSPSAVSPSAVSPSTASPSGTSTGVAVTSAAPTSATPTSATPKSAVAQPTVATAEPSAVADSVANQVGGLSLGGEHNSDPFSDSAAAPGTELPVTKDIAPPANKSTVATQLPQTSQLPTNDKHSVADSTEALVGVSPPSSQPMSPSSTAFPTSQAASKAPHAAAAAPRSNKATINETLATGTHADASDSEVSDVEQPFGELSDAEPDSSKAVTEDSFAYRADKDMAVFNEPVGSAAKTGDRDDASVWSFDARHKDEGNTFKKDRSFEPIMADVPVDVERKLSETTHKFENPAVSSTRDPTEIHDADEEVLRRRRSSVGTSAAPKRRGSRKATGSFGEEAAALKPLSQIPTDATANKAANESPLFFSEGLPSTTTGK